MSKDQELKPDFKDLKEPETFIKHIQELTSNGTISTDKNLDRYTLKLSYQVQHKEPSIIINGSNILNPGEFGGITGLPGSGKTSAIEAFIVAFLASKHCLDNLDTLGIKIRSQGRNCALLDTERPPDDNRYSFGRIERRLKLSERQNLLTASGEEIQGFKYLMFAQVKTLKKLKELLKTVFETGQYELIIIDGILDFVVSMNNEEDTREVIQWIRAMCVQHNCTTLMTLHPNKNTDTMAGHLGSNIYRWGRACLLVRNCDSDRTVKELTTDFSMGKLSHADMFNFSPVYFTWSNSEKLMVGCDKPQETIYSKKAFRVIFDLWLASGKGKEIPAGELKERYASELGFKGETAKKHIQAATSNELLVSSGQGKNTKYSLNETDSEKVPF